MRLLAKRAGASAEKDPYPVPRPTVAFGMMTPVEQRRRGSSSPPPEQTAEQLADTNKALAAVDAAEPANDELPELYAESDKTVAGA